MDEASVQVRDAVVMLIDQSMQAEARHDAPLDEERHNWAFGSIGFTEPDRNGWMAPSLPKMWVPRALCFWHGALWGGGAVNSRLMIDPAHSLKRWPVIEDAVGDYLAESAWLID